MQERNRTDTQDVLLYVLEQITAAYRCMNKSVGE